MELIFAPIEKGNQLSFLKLIPTKSHMVHLAESEAKHYHLEGWIFIRYACTSIFLIASFS